MTSIKKKNKFLNKKLLIMSSILVFIFLSVNVVNTDIVNLFNRQPNTIVVQAKGFKSGGFKSGSFSSGSSKSGGFKSGSFSSGSGKSSGGGFFGGSGSSSSKSKSYSSGSGGHTYIPIPIFGGGWNSSHYGGYSVIGSIASGFVKFILFIVVVIVIFNIIKRNRRY